LQEAAFPDVKTDASYACVAYEPAI